MQHPLDHPLPDSHAQLTRQAPREEAEPPVPRDELLRPVTLPRHQQSSYDVDGVGDDSRRHCGEKNHQRAVLVEPLLSFFSVLCQISCNSSIIRNPLDVNHRLHALQLYPAARGRQRDQKRSDA